MRAQAFFLPVPGDGRYEWSGFLKGDELPQVFNPEQGWFATANKMNIPRGYPVAEGKASCEWSDPSRITRLKEVLSAKGKMTLADAVALQTDDYGVNGRRLTKLLQPLWSEDPSLSEGLKLLKDWNHFTSVESAGAALIEVWMTKHLGRSLVAKAVPEPARVAISNLDVIAVISYLENPDSALGPVPRGARDVVLLEILKAAVIEVRQLLGPDVSTWTWENSITLRACFEMG